MPSINTVFRVKTNFFMLKREGICFKMILTGEIEPKKNWGKDRFFHTKRLGSYLQEESIFAEKKQRDYKRKIF